MVPLDCYRIVPRSGIYGQEIKTDIIADTADNTNHNNTAIRPSHNMSLSLSQLFEQHKSQSKNEAKHSDDEAFGGAAGSSNYDDGDDSIANERKRSPVPMVVDSNDGPSGGSSRTTRRTSSRKRTTRETPGFVKMEEEGSSSEDDRDVDGDFVDYGDFDDDEKTYGKGKNVNKKDRFYENYSETTKALYNIQNPRNHTPSEALDAIYSALFPHNNNNSGTLIVGNERRLAGEEPHGNNDDGGGGGAYDYPSKSLVGRYRPRKRRLNPHAALKKEEEVAYRLETEKEVKDRVRRMEGYNERSQLRVRWKKRSVNVQDEEDVGRAFHFRAKQSLDAKLREGKKERRRNQEKERRSRKKRRKKEEMEKTRELENSDILEEDDEVKEQSQLLAQLSQPDPAVKVEEDDAVRADDVPSSDAPIKNRDYWKKGYTIPKKSHVSFEYDLAIEKMVEENCVRNNFDKNKSIKNDAGDDGPKASFWGLVRPPTFTFYDSSRFFFTPNKTPLVTNGNTTCRQGYRRGHVPHMMSMAARSLCGGSTAEIALENHYLRLLCLRDGEASKKKDAETTICANFRTGGYLTTIAEDLGNNMLLYLQNTWNDPVEVAKQLGILDYYQDSPMRGNLLTNFSVNSKTNKSQIKKLHKIRSANWSHDSSNNNYNDDDKNLDEEVVLPDREIVPEMATSGAVVDAITLETSLTVDEKRFFEASNNDARDAFISPNTFYNHIPGTSPPIPQHPMDPSACLFGPVDRYSKFHHGSVRMDSSSYRLMLSTLMKRIGRARALEKESVEVQIREQILNLIENFANINENKFYLRYTNYIQDPSDSDIPMVEFYRGVMGYCAYMANGYLEMHGSDSSEDNSPQASGMSLVAGKIWEFCRPKIRHNPLFRFPRLRIVFGVALICHSLPPPAAEILSRPVIESDGFSTPLELFKQTLQYLETKNYITMDRHFEDKNSIRAVELEFVLHDAAEVFHEAVKLDPINVDYQLWHIGCLAACLLVSSGNKISESARVYPSQIKGSLMKNYKSAAHEVRPCMKKYNEVRIELSAAIGALLTLAKYQNSAKIHYAMFSLLEWGQVIGLLVGSQLENFLNDIERLHAFHFGAWARNEPSAFRRIYKSIADQKICKPSIFAQILENEPGEIQNWRNFVRCLGPISKTKDAADWWGKDRDWWRDSLLYGLTPDTGSRRFAKDDSSIVVKKVLAQVRKASDVHSILTDCSTDETEQDCEDRSDCETVDWLPTRQSVKAQNANQIDVSKEQRCRCYANDLPKARRHTSDDSEKTPIQDLCSLSEEAQAYKIFISCHLFGLDHQSVRKVIYYNLFSTCMPSKYTIKVNEDCDQFRVLVWLSSMGIAMENIVQDI